MDDGILVLHVHTVFADGVSERSLTNSGSYVIKNPTVLGR